MGNMIRRAMQDSTHMRDSIDSAKKRLNENDLWLRARVKEINQSIKVFRKLKVEEPGNKRHFIDVDVDDPNLSKKMLDDASMVNDIVIQCGVARHPNTSAAALSHLVMSRYSEVQYFVALNPNATEFALTHISKVWLYSDIRCLIAKHHNTPESVLANLAEDKIVDVRISVAENPKTPEHVLENLKNDESMYVQKFAEENLSRRKGKLKLRTAGKKITGKKASGGAKLPKNFGKGIGEGKLKIKLSNRAKIRKMRIRKLFK